jgi:hypothetical protein
MQYHHFHSRTSSTMSISLEESKKSKSWFEHVPKGKHGCPRPDLLLQLLPLTGTEDMQERVGKAAERIEGITFTFGLVTFMRIIVVRDEAEAFQHFPV